MLKLLFPANHRVILPGLTAECPELASRVEHAKLNAVEIPRFVDNVAN
jgi:hypothetical protein